MRKQLPISADILSAALLKYQTEAIGSAYPPIEECNKHFTPNKETDAKILKLINFEKKPYYLLINTVGKRVACIIIAIILAFTTTVFSVKATRETIIEFITERFRKYTQVSIDNEKHITEEEFVTMAPQYIPEGYALQIEEKIGVMSRRIYCNEENKRIHYTQNISFGTVGNFNTEGVECEKISINSFEGIKYSKKGTTSVVFSDDTYLHYISGQVSFEELLKMLESLEEIK